MPKQEKKSKVPIKRVAKATRGRKVSPITDSRLGISSHRLTRQPKTSSGKDSFGSFLRVTGREFVSTVTCPSTPSPGQVLYQRENLVSPDNTRLHQFSPLYYRWRPVVYKYHFIPTQPTTVGGTLVSGVDIEPGVPWTDGPANIAKARALENSSISQLFEPTTFSLPATEANYTDLWCDPFSDAIDAEDRLAAAGRAVMCIAAVGGITSGMVLGLLELEYDIKFYHPRLQNLSDMGSSTAGTIPIPEVFPTGGATKYNVLRRIVKKIQDIPINSIVNGAKILQQISNAKLWPETVAFDEKSPHVSDTSPVGLPEGIYEVKWYVLSPDGEVDPVALTFSGTWNFSNAGSVMTSGQTQAFIQDSSGIGASFVIAGVVYNIQAAWTHNFEVVSGATNFGYSDLAISRDNLTPGTNDLLYYEISCINPDQFFPFSASSVGKAVRKRAYPPLSIQASSTVTTSSSSSSGMHSAKMTPLPPEPMTPGVIIRPLRVKA